MVLPERLDILSIVTIVGGTVGGYITFAGAHRLIDAGIVGATNLGAVTRSATLAIGVASVMRIVLFLGALGVVAGGFALDPANPSADVFRRVAGAAGYRIFGLVMWAAAITSVVGSAYTSVSFLRSLGPAFERNWRMVTIAFIALSTVVFLVVGRPVKVLVAVGALNALILPLSLGAMLVAARTSPHRRRVSPPILAARERRDRGARDGGDGTVHDPQRPSAALARSAETSLTAGKAEKTRQPNTTQKSSSRSVRGFLLPVFGFRAVFGLSAVTYRPRTNLLLVWLRADRLERFLALAFLALVVRHHARDVHHEIVRRRGSPACTPCVLRPATRMPFTGMRISMPCLRDEHQLVVGQHFHDRHRVAGLVGAIDA